MITTLPALSDREVILALSDRGAGVPLRELVLVGLTAAIVTYFATGGVRVLATRLGALAYPRKRD
ncbi:MAG: undecaprenyl-phosphate alpha-N-acetylglucosaminyl 1-phosphate transferase, partial [Mycobacterium sp.]|nr:undecaprenyl-phosphate alpha-N-acetylglucosaminyl 1-phosphate transferase [Mycobacterium sp.]